MTEYDEQLIIRFIEKITVFDEKFTVEFKSGLETDIEMQNDTVRIEAFRLYGLDVFFEFKRDGSYEYAKIFQFTFEMSD